ncbi:MAG TPA: aquaporin [Geminicoccaceae bacterium]|nr:aquaporin [Geminicoccaceae bacterium]
MSRSVDVADVPALLEAMVGWLDPANDVGESAILRWQSQGIVPPALADWVTRWTAKPVDALRRHWPEYLMEAAGLGLFMISAGLFGTLLFHPGSPVAQALPDPSLQRALMGLIMGLTAIAIIYSPWGQQSGAHINPAVTLTFWRLGKVAGWDAAFYVAAQFAGGALGVLAVLALLGALFADPPVSYVATVPGAGGVALALLAEAAISFGLMSMILFATNTPRLMRLTGVFAGCLVALYITFEAPLSGMSMNPARTVASALPGALWQGLWIYFVGPIAGMLLAVEAYRLIRRTPEVICAKLNHHTQRRCIFRCGYDRVAGPVQAD